ncbi:vWA domain-containing protein [Oligosphaera ethanolica]|uniref:VWFA domain-containing protein n=1 Tax=Oligosphaera ethanolica TaxID=760260 RepID=A0AAE3VHJ3_9BACT|nr:vWA domain-containing protein [Oligosphaera ethanolica]MDQ0290555.1 hypothetical protein [Oligosphaera ethanolica]
MKMLRKLFLLAIVLAGTTATASTPMINCLLLGATSSVSEEDFQKERLAAIKFITAYYVRAQNNPACRSDWLCVNFFGGDDDYTGMPFFKCDDEEAIQRVVKQIATMPHPKYKNSSVYTAIGRGLLECMEKEKSLSGKYAKNIIIVTSGQDNSSDPGLVESIKKSFPNRYASLCIIGVGSKANMASLGPLADICINVDNFDNLLIALILAGQ